MEELEESTYSNINKLVHNFYKKCDISNIDEQTDLICDINIELFNNMKYSRWVEYLYMSKIAFDIKTKGIFVYFAAYNNGNNYSLSEY